MWNDENRERLNELLRVLTFNKRNSDPIFKFITTQRSRIRQALLNNKSTTTIELLGCSSQDFFRWINNHFTDELLFENHGAEWHIDHVIPISLFNLNIDSEKFLCFNWRNTMPLSKIENLKKGNKIVQPQIEIHLNNLLKYHQEYNIEFPQEFIDLFARHNQIAGNPLES